MYYTTYNILYPPHLMVEERRMMVRVRQVMQTAHRQDTYLKWFFSFVLKT